MVPGPEYLYCGTAVPNTKSEATFSKNGVAKVRQGGIDRNRASNYHLLMLLSSSRNQEKPGPYEALLSAFYIPNFV